LAVSGVIEAEVDSAPFIYRTKPETATAANMTGRERMRQTVVRLAPAALLGILAFALVLAATDPPGPGLDPDALSYMGAAESLVAHGTYRIPAAPWTSVDSMSPLAHFPPGYSTALAIPVALGMTPPQAARLVDALAAAVTVITLVLVVGAATSLLAGILLGVALLATPAMATVHLSVLSEPLFLALLALMLAAMVYAPDRPLRAGVVAAFAAMVRYAGVALVGAAVLWPFMWRAPWRERVRDAVIAVLPAALLMVTWVVRTRIATGGEHAIRHFAIYGDLGPTLREGGATLRDWLVPDADTEWPLPHREVVALGAAAVFVALVVLGARSARADPGSRAWRTLRACAALVACYAAIVIVSRLVADPAIPLDERILAPFLMLVATGAAVAIACWWRTTDSHVARAAVAAALVGWCGSSASVALDDGRFALDYGSDFASEEWRHSPVLDWARTSGASHPLYTNWPAAVYFHLHRPSYSLPTEGETETLASFVDTLRRRNGRVLLFKAVNADDVVAPSLIEQPGLRVLARTSDGVVLAPVSGR
jgi:4-amino-4-deoxy-L-arabinose transferase-like glycosyltransferase